MPKYRIDNIDDVTRVAIVTFFSDDGRNVTEHMGDLPLEDADKTISELTTRLQEWAGRLEKPRVNIDPKLDDMILQINEVELAGSEGGH